MSPASPSPRGSSPARFVLVFVACCAVSLLPLLPGPYPFSWLFYRFNPEKIPWLWAHSPGPELLLILAVAFADQLRLALRQHGDSFVKLLTPVVLCAVIVIGHDTTFLSFPPLLVVNVAVAAKAVCRRTSLGGILVLLAATYLLSINVINFVVVYRYQGMFQSWAI